jgi:hypothetical protein
MTIKKTNKLHMKNAWLGYLSSVFLLIAGVLQIVAGKLILGSFFIGLSIVGLIVKTILNSRGKQSGGEV